MSRSLAQSRNCVPQYHLCVCKAAHLVHLCFFVLFFFLQYLHEGLLVFGVVKAFPSGSRAWDVSRRLLFSLVLPLTEHYRITFHTAIVRFLDPTPVELQDQIFVTTI